MAYLTQFSNSVAIIKFPIDQSVMTIGQNIDMDICVAEDGIADNHAVIEVSQKAKKFHFNIKSRLNESMLDLNGEHVAHAELNDGDWLIIGGVEFQFTDDDINEIKDNFVQINTFEDVKPIKVEILANEDKTPMTTKEFIEDSRFSRRLNRL